MIQHIMLWSYKEETPAEERERLERELVELPERIPTLRRVEWGSTVGGHNHNFTHCFVMYFDDLNSLQEYATHPNHLHFSVPFKEACQVQVVVDFEDGSR